MIRNVLLALAFCCACGLSAQSFTLQTGTTANFQKATLDLDELRAGLATAPKEFGGEKSSTTVSLPMPDGNFADFTVYNSDLLPDYPRFESYRVTGPWGGGRIATSPSGMSAVLRGPDGYFIIEPTPGDDYRIAAYGDYMELLNEAQGALACGFDEETMPAYDDIEISQDFLDRGEIAGAVNGLKSGNEARELRVYDLIITCTGEFAQQVGGTEEAVIEAFNTATSTINAIFEQEIGIRMALNIVPGLIYLDAATDPYVDATTGRELLGQVLGAFTDNNVNLNSYDLGHILTSSCDDVGGVVSGSACNNIGKTRGVTCVGGSVVGAALRIMAHEVAHQFNVSHSWNNCPGSEGQRASQTSFEPGSGTTIMSYAGACGSNNIGGEDSYYHVGSLQQFLTFTRETGAADCATVVETSNFTPEVSFEYTDDFYLPISTPFRLAGTATDANNDNLTYNWEQYDLGPASDVRDPTGNAPLFRSVPPEEDGNVRYFPNLFRIVNAITDKNETLPTYSRDMTFRLTARDNNSEAGGVDWKELQFFAEETAGPFVVNEPADTEWNIGDFQEVTWDVANTNVAPVNCKRVNILMSTDNGETFEVVLANNVANNGRAFVTVPATAIPGQGDSNDNIRLMVEAADNIFLNVNAERFTVLREAEPGFTLESSVRYDDVCLPETVSVDLTTGSILEFANPISLSVDPTTLPDGVVADFTSNSLMPGEAATLNLDLTNVRFSGLLELTVVAAAEGLDTARRQIFLEVTDNDYSDLATVSPAEGTTGIILTTAFGWTEAANADTYDVQVATSPTFAEETIFEELNGLTGTGFTPAEFFESNTLYYWRVRPSNVCGAGAWTATNSFRTINSACEPFASTDTPIGLPGNGPAFTRESILFIETAGAISDINLPNVNVRYNFASEVTVTLVSPAGTEVILYDRKCFSSNRVDVGFDDDAPIEVVCPADDQRVFIPNGSLADFNGEDTFGEWMLRVDVGETGGSAGSIQGWEIEFCADVAAIAPSRIANTATECRPGERSVVLRERLEVNSDVYGSDDIVYTITGLPTAGEMFLYGNTLMVGDTFRQADINGRGLFYVNTDATAETDELRFVVSTPDGGYLPVTAHDVLITEDAVVSADNVSELDAGLTVFPNPVGNDLSIRWTRALNRDLDVQLFDLNGRLLQSRTVDGAAKAAAMRTGELPAGVYLLRIDGAVRRIVKR